MSAARDIPGYIWDPDTNRYYKNEGGADSETSQRKERIAKKKQEKLLTKIPMVKLQLDDNGLRWRCGVVRVVPETTVSQLKESNGLHYMLMESKLGGSTNPEARRYPNQLPAEAYSRMVVANFPVEGYRPHLWDERNLQLSHPETDNGVLPIINGIYQVENIVSWYRDNRSIREFEFPETCEILSISHRDDRVFFSLYDEETCKSRGVWAKIKENGEVGMFKSGYFDPAHLSALIPKRYLTNESGAPLCLFASENTILYVYNDIKDPTFDLYTSTCENESDEDEDEEDEDPVNNWDISDFLYLDEPGRFNALVWAEYETKDNIPTAFAAATGNDIVKIVFKDGDEDTFWETLPGNSSIAVLKSHPSTKKLFAITFHGKLFTIDWTGDNPILSPEIDLRPFGDPSGTWSLQIVDDEKVWVGQESKEKVYLWSWKSPLQPLAVVDLNNCWLRSLQSVGPTCVISVD
jgi:hypothetical protein